MEEENSGVFTVVGILAVLVLGVAVFWILYTSLATPISTG